MIVVTDIDYSKVASCFLITKQEVEVVVRIYPDKFGGREIVATLSPVGKPLVEEITIGP